MKNKEEILRAYYLISQHEKIEYNIKKLSGTDSQAVRDGICEFIEVAQLDDEAVFEIAAVIRKHLAAHCECLECDIEAEGVALKSKKKGV